MYFMLGNVAFEPVDLTDFNETRRIKRQTALASYGRKTL